MLKISSLELPGISSSSCLKISENLIYLTGPFSIIDISDIHNPIILYSDNTFIGPSVTGSTINVLGGYCFIDNKILDIKDPTKPVIKSNFNIKGKCEFIQGNCAYISSDEGISVYNISDIQNPQQIGYYPTNFFMENIYDDGYDGWDHGIYAYKNYIYSVNQESNALQAFRADLINTKPFVNIYSDSIFAD